MLREVSDRTDNNLIECRTFVEEVVQVNLAEEGQGNVAPSESEDDFEEEPAALEEVVESVRSVTN